MLSPMFWRKDVCLTWDRAGAAGSRVKRYGRHWMTPVCDEKEEPGSWTVVRNGFLAQLRADLLSDFSGWLPQRG